MKKIDFGQLLSIVANFGEIAGIGSRADPPPSPPRRLTLGVGRVSGIPPSFD
jgi:hypothetical protein